MPRIAVYVDPSADGVALRNAERGLSNLETDRVVEVAEADVVILAVDEDFNPDLTSFRRSRPFGLAIGFTRSLDPQVWTAAEQAGIDKVVATGRLAIAIREALSEGFDAYADRRIPVCSVSDVAGRLGFLAAVQTPLGEMGLFRISGGLRCIGLSCPHAGASLATGEIAESTITCPAHGSQFSLDNGSRERGPADCGVASLQVVEEMGRYYIVTPL